VTTSGAISREKGDLAAGTQIGRYRIEDPVGRGGMGTVYRTFDETTNRNVALKLLAPGIPPSLRHRFLAECEAEANIRHEHVMPVYDRGWLSEERPYFVMELLYEPITLSEIVEHIQKGTLSQTHPRLRHWNDLRRLVADVVLPICEGVAVANMEYGVQHRDLKPENVLIDIRTKRAYLIDFGICREMDDISDEGKIVGTPRFLSPEQARARTDDRTDVWGLGGILRYVITGQPPLAGTSPFSRAQVQERIAALTKAEAEAKTKGEDAKARGYAKRREQLEDPTLRVQEDLLRDARDGIYIALPDSLSASLTAIVNKAMACASEDRYADAGALVRDVRAWLGGAGVQALSEQGKRGAAVDWARRLLNQNVVRAVGTALALVLGWIVGTGLFQTTPPVPDFRAEDAKTRLAAIERDWQAMLAPESEEVLPPIGLMAAQWRLRRQWTLIRGPDLPADQDTIRQYSPLEEAIKTPAILTLDGWHAKEYAVDNLAHLATSGEWMKNTAGSFFTGAYQVSSRNRGGLFLRLVVPPHRNPPAAGGPGHGFHRTNQGRLERVLRLGAEPKTVPSGMTWVPTGPVAPGDDQVIRAFVAGIRPVTNEQYSEWLDDLLPGKRHARVPPTGFHRDERDPRRWLVVPTSALQAVRGVRPADAKAYAAWRSEAEAMPLRLPTSLEWQRMTGIDQMNEPGADVIFPWRRATTGRALRRRGATASKADTDVSPYGVRGLFAGSGEIVTGLPSGTFTVKGAGGLRPTVHGALRQQPIDAAAAGHGYGFRLVYGP